MDETGAYQPGYGVFGIGPVAEFACDLLDAPRPRISVEHKANDGVVDLIVREPSPAVSAWNTLLLHGKAFLSVPGPGQLALRRGHYVCGLYTVDDKALARQNGCVQPRSPGHVAFGRAIREFREERGVSQEAFALRCGIDRSHYGGIERGERNPSLSHIFKIADALGVQPSEIHARAEQILDSRS
jgi:DNA-binding XRE family transcriptional regulator